MQYFIKSRIGSSRIKLLFAIELEDNFGLFFQDLKPSFFLLIFILLWEFVIYYSLLLRELLLIGSFRFLCDLWNIKHDFILLCWLIFVSLHDFSLYFIFFYLILISVFFNGLILFRWWILFCFFGWIFFNDLLVFFFVMNCEHLVILDTVLQQPHTIVWIELTILLPILSFQKPQNIVSQTFLKSCIHSLVFFIFLKAEHIVNIFDCGFDFGLGL